MKSIKCELCGSNDLKKIDGEFVCQYCGTKYSLEEARKLMVEIEGTVKVDNSSQISNLENLAERALNDGAYDKADEYYGKLLELNSNNWNYIYNKALCEANLGDLRAIVDGCQNAFNVMNHEQIKVEDPQEMYRKMAFDINELAYYYAQPINKLFNSNNINKKSISEAWDILIDCIDVDEYAARLIKRNVDDNEETKKLYIVISKNIVYFCDVLGRQRTYIIGWSGLVPIMNSMKISQATREKYFAIYNTYKHELMKYDPSFVERMK